eukprot:jgi/Antlo1/154/486
MPFRALSTALGCKQLPKTPLKPMGGKQIGISILNSDIFDIESELALVNQSGIHHVHIDIMDTSFTENISFGPSIVNHILEKYDFVFDVHLMVRNPLPVLKLLNLKRIDTVFIHVEVDDVCNVLRWCAEHEVNVGVAINPETSLDVVLSFASRFVLIMCVKPGFGGQAFRQECVAKIKTLKRNGFVVGVDGGINAETISLASDADYFVVGSAFFNSKNKKAFVQSLYSRIS